MEKKIDVKKKYIKVPTILLILIGWASCAIIGSNANPPPPKGSQLKSEELDYWSNVAPISSEPVATPSYLEKAKMKAKQGLTSLQNKFSQAKTYIGSRLSPQKKTPVTLNKTQQVNNLIVSTKKTIADIDKQLTDKLQELDTILGKVTEDDRKSVKALIKQLNEGFLGLIKTIRSRPSTQPIETTARGRPIQHYETMEDLGLQGDFEEYLRSTNPR